MHQGEMKSAYKGVSFLCSIFLGCFILSSLLIYQIGFIVKLLSLLMFLIFATCSEICLWRMKEKAKKRLHSATWTLLRWGILLALAFLIFAINAIPIIPVFAKTIITGVGTYGWLRLRLQLHLWEQKQ